MYLPVTSVLSKVGPVLRRILGVNSIMLLSGFTLGCSANITKDSSVETRTKTLSTELATELEPIYEFTPHNRAIRILVRSTGCTQPEDFTLELQKRGEQTYTVTIKRKKPDRCRASPRLFPVELSLQEPLPDRVKLNVENPFGLPDSLARRRDKG